MRLEKLIILACLLAGITFFGWLGERDIVTSHEARVAQTARIMAESGWCWERPRLSVPLPQLQEHEGQIRLRATAHQIEVNPWIIPVLNGEIRLNKPPLPYWCCAIVFKLLGAGEWQARLVPAAMGAIALLLIYDLARLLAGRRTAVVAAIIWATTHFVVDEFRKSMADPYLAFFTLLAIWTWLRANLKSRPGAGRGGYVLLFHLALALGILAKGPVIFVTVVPALLVLHLVRRQSIVLTAWHLPGLLLILIVVAPWLAAVVREIPNAVELWRYDAFESQEKAKPPWMYLVHLPQFMLPWTPLWVVGVIVPFLHPPGRRFNRGNRKRLSLLLWTAAVLLLFSLKPVKKDAYLFPLMPALVLTTADAACILLAFARRIKSKGLPGVLMTAQTIIGIAFALGVGVMLLRSYPDRWLGITAVLVLLIASLQPLIPLLRKAPRRWFFAQGIAYAVILAIFMGMAWSRSQDNRSPRAFAAKLLMYSRGQNLPIALARSPEELSFYLPLQNESPLAEHMLLVLDRPTEAELRDADYISEECDFAIVERWEIIEALRGRRYVAIEVFLNRSRAQKTMDDLLDGEDASALRLR